MKKPILFVCVENAGRSQMAEGFARILGGGFWEPFSAGSSPSGRLNPLAVQAMREIGIDISQNRSKGFSDLPALPWDTVVTMGCGDKCPILPARKIVHWELPDPKGQNLPQVRRIRDTIRNQIFHLLQQIKNE